MFGRQREGSTVCPSCGRLVGVRDEACFSCGARNPALYGFGPALRRLGGDLALANLLLGACGVLYLVSLLLSGGAVGSRGGLFGLLAPSERVLFLLGSSGAVPVFGYGRWWTVLSAGWLHAGLIHIGFNLMWVRDLAPAVAQLYGAGRLLIIYVVAGVTGFAMSAVMGVLGAGMPYFLRGAGFTVGASASLFGLFGALLCYGQRSGQSALRQTIWRWLLIGVFIGFLPGIDNWAHGGGLLGGWLTARVLDPLRDEKPVHVLLGLAGLVASLAAVVMSIVTALPLLRG